jgi:homopolymeric O-antigen transport system permease protein
MSVSDRGTTVTEYTPEPLLRSPGKLFRSMWHDLLASRELAWRLTVRDISAAYRRSMLGVLWAFIPPIAMALVFIVLKRASVVQSGETPIPYAASVMIGTVLWQLFTQSLNAPLKSVTANRVMLTRINFPREALIVAAIGRVGFDFCVRLVILAVVFIVFGIPLSWGVLGALFPILMLMMLGIMIGMLLTPLGMLYTDITSALPVMTGLWFFLTPVVYQSPKAGVLSWLVRFNPVSPLLLNARGLATGQGLVDPTGLAVVSGVTCVGLLAMWLLYRISLPILTERIGA